MTHEPPDNPQPDEGPPTVAVVGFPQESPEAAERRYAVQAAHVAMAFIQCINQRGMRSADEDDGLWFSMKEEADAYRTACRWIGRFFAEWT